MSIKLIIWLIGIIIYFIYKIVSSSKKKEGAQEVIVDKPVAKPIVYKNFDPIKAVDKPVKVEKKTKSKTTQTTKTIQETVLEQQFKHTVVENDDLKPAQLEHFEIVKTKPHPLKTFLSNKSNLKKAFITAEIINKKA